MEGESPALFSLVHNINFKAYFLLFLSKRAFQELFGKNDAPTKTFSGVDDPSASPPCSGGMVPSYSGILAKAISIALPLHNKDNLFLSLGFSLGFCISEAVVRICSAKKVLFKILQSSQVFPLTQVLPVNFAKF